MTEENQDPFSAELAPGVALIVQMRIYDLLGAILTEMNEDLATSILKKHDEGGFYGPLPWVEVDE